MAINASKFNCATTEAIEIGTAPTNGSKKKLLTEKKKETKKFPVLAFKSSNKILKTRKTTITPVIPNIIDLNRVLRSSIYLVF